MRIFTLSKNETIEYAAIELKKYITMLSRGAVVPEICFEGNVSASKEADRIILGSLEELSLDRSDLADPFIEDIIDIDIKNGSGYIAGSNPRSILMGVYRYCTSAGCCFMRPGADGEYIPHTDIKSHSFRYRKKADHPFRGQCCEGAFSYEHVRDTVYWLPKVGMNMFMIEGFVPYTYMHKWYGHVGNKKLRQKGQVTDWKMLEAYMDLLEQDIKKVGIQLHTLGHAWMFEKLGIHNGPPSAQAAALREEDKKYLALVNGKRDLMYGSSFYTHFCYSNPAARRILLDTLLEYVQKKPYVDFVHVWLADNNRNQCECDECVKLEPSDHYVNLLNELDEELTRIGSEARIVLIAYADTVRPPRELQLKNPGRFILLYTAQNHHESSYVEIENGEIGEIPPYVRNKPTKISSALRMKWHRDWKKSCGNIPSFVFEYRFYIDMYCDLGHMQISRETYRDMKDLDKVDLQGCMNDQTHRIYMPTSLPLIVMGETLFDTDVSFEQLADSYFEGAFGAEGAKCREYLEKLTELLCPSNFRVGGNKGLEEAALGTSDIRKKNWIDNEEVAKKAAQIPGLLEEFLPVIHKNIALATDPARMLSWRYLEYHSRICTLFAQILAAGAQDKLEEAQKAYFELEDYLSEHELEFHNGFDVFLFLRALRSKLNLPFIEYFD